MLERLTGKYILCSKDFQETKPYFYKSPIILFIMQEPNYTEIISKELNLKPFQVEKTLNLLEEQNTVPFIARYRKEVTGNLDENQIRKIQEIRQKEENIFKAKQSALKNIEEQGKLVPQLKENIVNAKTLKEVEDLYAPFKKKKKTKAMIAIEKGFQPVAIQIKEQKVISIPKDLLDKYSEEDIIEGAKDIISQEIADDAKNRDALRYYFKKYGEIISKYKTKLDELPNKIQNQTHKFEIYNDFRQEVYRLKSYQTLALNRGENLKILNIKLEKDTLPQEELEEKYIKTSVNAEILKECVKEGFKKLFSSIETEIRNMLTEKAEEDAIETFQQNLKQLLMTKPQYGKTVLAIDPGFRTGCKIAVIDKNNNPVEFSKIYVDKKELAISKLKSLISKHSPNVIVIGNGTASNETVELINKNFDIEHVVINESGASVYSASEAGNEEFPDLDATDRGTVSIGRRYIDPLSELVKIPPHNIGVGMYQHDINQKELGQKLSYVVEDVVNMVGININTASVYILSYISGLSKKSAKKIFDNRSYKSRKELSRVLTKKTFEQAAGFLRVPESLEKFDNTSIHPEQYTLAEYVIKMNIKTEDFGKEKEKLIKLYPNATAQTISDIQIAYENLGKDPRVYEANMKLDKTLNIEDLKEGDIVDGIVRNITQFGAFVDIGLKNDGLIHISQLADKFVKNPADIVEIGEQLKVKVIGIDQEKGKVQLSLKDID